MIEIFTEKQIKRGNLRNCGHLAKDSRLKVVQGKTNLKTMTMKKGTLDVCSRIPLKIEHGRLANRVKFKQKCGCCLADMDM